MGDPTVLIDAINRLRDLYRKSGLKEPKGLLGELGEFLVIRELLRNGYAFEKKGGQGGYDVLLKNPNRRIEIKTSTLKNNGEYKDKHVRFWGWAIERKSQKQKDKFDYFIGIALDDKIIESSQFYIFSADELRVVGEVNNLGRFRNVKRAVHLFESPDAYVRAIKVSPENARATGGLINENPELFLNKWSKFK